MSDDNGRSRLLGVVCLAGHSDMTKRPPKIKHGHDASEWTHDIRPESRLFDLRLRELWHSRDLVALFFRRDFVALYKQTLLGPAWYLIQPLLTTVVFTVVFGRIARLPTNGIPAFLFYMSGTVVWSYFATCLTKTSTTFLTNSQLFGKVYFPRIAVPVSVVASNLVAFAIQIAMLCGFLCYYFVVGASVSITLWILLAPYFTLVMAALGMGIGIGISAATVKYRDLQYLVAFGVQLLMYATPVIYPLSDVHGRLRVILLANPMTTVIEGFRLGFIGAGTVNAQMLAYTSAWAAGALLVGTALFHRTERTFMDTV